MLLVDERIGSKDLLQPLIRAGVPAELQHLEFGDFAFIGRGLEGVDVFIGIELKETRDLISSLRSSRFPGHQLPGLQSFYDRAWLVTEGIWRAGDDGVLETMRGGWQTASVGPHCIMASDLDSWILSQTIRGGISHWHCSTRRDTLRFIATLYKWWTDKSLDEHRSHEAMYIAPPDRAMLTEPSACQKMISCLPGVGWDKAMKIDAACLGSIVTLTNMSAQELQKIQGIGKKTAEGIRSALLGSSA